MKLETKKLILAALFSALTIAGAFIKIPLGFTYITLQFFFAAMAGIVLGGKWGAVSQGNYVLIGLLGLPVFTQGGGLTYLLNPSCGFLFGLIAAAFIIGVLTQKFRTFWGIAFSCLVGLLALYAVGLPYMYIVMKLYLNIDIRIFDIIKAGMLLYLPGDFIKIIVSAALAGKLTPFLKRKKLF